MDWTPELLSPGYVVHGRYTIEAVIGKGGMGAVYRARHDRLGRVLAIKVLHPHMARNPVMVERFHREARAAGSIGHDNICEVTEFGATEDGLSYLVMPHLKGVPYSDVLVREELSMTRVVDIFAQVLKGLDAAHRAQIVHRDLKPENVLITQVGDRSDFVKLLDFGISKMLNDDESAAGLTRTGSVFGTPHYMSPEQARGSKRVDERTDIYAVGVMLYETLTGRRPYHGDSWNEVMYNILNEPFPPPTALNESVSPELNQIVLRALSRDTAARYQHAAVMADELEAVLGRAPNPEQVISVLRSPKQSRVDAMPVLTHGAEFNRKIDTTAGDDSEVWRTGKEMGSSSSHPGKGRSGFAVRRRWLVASAGLVLATLCAYGINVLSNSETNPDVIEAVPATQTPAAPPRVLPVPQDPPEAAGTEEKLELSPGSSGVALTTEPKPNPEPPKKEPADTKTKPTRPQPTRTRSPRVEKNRDDSPEKPPGEVIEGWSGSVFYTEY